MLHVVLVASVVGIVSYVLLMMIFPSLFSSKKSDHTSNALLRIMDETQASSDSRQDESIIKDGLSDSFILRVISEIPFIGYKASDLILQSGMGKKAGLIVIITVLIVTIIFIALNSSSSLNGLLALLISVAVGFFIVAKYLKGRIKKRVDVFIEMFPDVLDMIVRSVRSGFPLNTAVKLVAENMEPPISTEFKQVSDEVALGRPLNHALARLAERIPEPDIRFFVVVLNVQQETGGNLSEVISNLSNIIRKRKHLRLKIKAMTSEARATGVVLGGLPIVLFGVLSWMTPEHLEPLFTPSGSLWLFAAIGLIVSAFVIIRQMIDIDIDI